MHAHGTPPVVPRKLVVAFNSCFRAYLPDETMSMASSDLDNADLVDPGSLPSGMRSFLGHVHIRGNAVLK